MERDPIATAGEVGRELRMGRRDGAETRVVVAIRTFDTDREDLWSALTDPERIPRWFLPIEGDLGVGGRYQLEGNAGGTIQECMKPERFAVTWEFMGGMSWVEVTLTADGDGTRMELAHEQPVTDHYRRFGAGATGIGWDLGLLGLGLHMTSGESVDPAQFESWSLGEDGKEFVTGSADAWRDAAVRGGEDPQDARTAAETSRAFFTGEGSTAGED